MSERDLTMVFAWPDRRVEGAWFSDQLDVVWVAPGEAADASYLRTGWVPLAWTPRPDGGEIEMGGHAAEAFARVPDLVVDRAGRLVNHHAWHAAEPSLAEAAWAEQDRRRALALWGRLVMAWAGETFGGEPIEQQRPAPPEWAESGVPWVERRHVVLEAPGRARATLELGPDEDAMASWFETSGETSPPPISHVEVTLLTDPATLVPHAMWQLTRTLSFQGDEHALRTPVQRLREQFWRFRFPHRPPLSDGARRYLDDIQRFRFWFRRAEDPPRTWREAAALMDGGLLDQRGQVHDPANVTRWVAAYQNGQFMTAVPRSMLLGAPDGLEFREDTVTSDEPATHVLDASELVYGLVEVSFGPSLSHPDDPNHYSTTLRNLTDQAFRVRRFGGYAPGEDPDQWVLHNFTRAFFGEREWLHWYCPGTDGWVPPGGSACDPDNYGGLGSLWAYEVEFADGRVVWVGEVVDGGEE